VRDERVVAPPARLRLIPDLPVRQPRGLALRGGEREHRRRDGVLPEEVPDEMVLADVGAEEIDPRRVWRTLGGCEGVEVRAPEHVGFADDAGRDCDGGYGGVEFGVGGGEEELFEEGAGVGEGVVGGGGGGVDDEGELVHEFVFFAGGGEAAEEVDHVRAGAAGGPDVAVDDPDEVAFGGEVALAHVANFGVGAEGAVGAEVGVGPGGVAAVEIGGFILDEDCGVVVGVFVDEGLEEGEGGVGARGDAEMDCELLAGVDLLEGGGEAVVEMGLKAFDGAEDCDVGDSLREEEVGD
jgi:hypothetical protein